MAFFLSLLFEENLALSLTVGKAYAQKNWLPFHGISHPWPHAVFLVQLSSPVRQ